MITNEKDILQGLKDLRLSETERTHMRSELLAYADMHSLPVVETKPFNSVAFLSSVFAHSRTLVAGALSLVLIIATGSATAFASEKTLPGDVLYPVKVNIAEPIASVFVGDGSAKARYHATLAVKRVQEAEALQARGDFTDTKAKELAQRFSEETERAEKEAARLAVSGDYSASLVIRTELATELSAHTAVLAESEDTSDSSDVATARTAKSAPVAMKAAVAVEERKEDAADFGFSQVVSRTVARLRTAETQPKVIAEKNVPALDKGGDPKEIAAHARARSQATSRALLSGASVDVEIGLEGTTNSATTSATSTPSKNSTYLQTLIKAAKTNGSSSVSDDKNSDSRDSKLDVTNTSVQSVQNSIRLLPLP